MTNKKAIFLFVGMVLVATIGIGIWANRLLSNMEEDEAMTEQLSVRILDGFSDHTAIQKYPVQLAALDWGTNCLVLENGGAGDLGVTYKSKWNEALGTTGNYPGDRIKGVVLLVMDMKEKGEYINKIGQNTKAYQRNYVINYVDLDKKAIIARDTLYGEEPPLVNRSAGSGAGDFPSDSEVVNSIKERLKL
ncbi:hypothetical protein [Sphingobacterium sp.]|uniref:hypothetical protein n=1 Tax=Sphingobacterium sp. TaxID=341027 RepID=UPI0028A0B470|nr:hypothetical protein [Sphingobacterium sp.]